MTDRLNTLKANMPSGADALLVTSPVNRRYYLNFPSSAGILLITKGENYFIIDSRYFEDACGVAEGCTVLEQGDDQYAQVLELLKKHGVKALAVEADKVSVSGFKKLEKELAPVEILSGDELSRAIEAQRSVKSREELQSIRLAQEISDKTFSHILNFIKPGKTELEIAIELEEFSRRVGSEGTAFSFIVAAGQNSSKPHAVPSKYEVRDGNFITLDFGSTINGYRSDMTRTVAVGHVSEKQREVYELVLKAQLEALGVIKAGIICSDVDKAARDIIDSSAYKGTFGHGLGHSLGLEIHEPPRFNKICDTRVKAGTVMSVEPGIYLPGEFGVRIEDIVVVTEAGYENFAKSDKNLIIL